MKPIYKVLLIIFAAFLLIVFVAYSFIAGNYNSMVAKDIAIKTAWAQVENVCQRRADLIPNLVNTIKGSSKFEQETLKQVMEARASATSIKIDPSNITPEQLAKFQAAQNQTGSAVSRLLAVAENYPELKSIQGYNDLAFELAGSENRIALERKKFNEAVQDYNLTIKTFPRNIIAGFFGFNEKSFFQADAGAEKPVKVDFN
jgi:LemA protein